MSGWPPGARSLDHRVSRFPGLALALALATVVAAGCGGGGSPGSPADAGDAPPMMMVTTPVAPECLPPAGVSRSPRTIADVVALLNSLPRPVTLPCLLQGLQRPLRLNGSRSFISLQPATGARSPRMFLLLDGLIMSVVPEGVGSALLEFGQFVSEDRTLKAELRFPIVAPIQPEEPFHKALNPTSQLGGTTCRTCHRQEEPAEQIPYAQAYVSGALRPDPRTAVDFASLLHERQHCTDDSDRCRMWRALFDHGEVQPGEFPGRLPTIFD